MHTQSKGTLANNVPASNRAAGWWPGAVGYEVYVRSFADSDGDGLGDLRGITSHLDHLAWLGVDAVWVTPFYPSPGFDHGYDVSDYVGVDPRHGTLDDFDELVTATHALGMKMVIDLVANHTSHLHPWFREARSGRNNPYRDYYLWRDPAPDGGPPNNWVSHFGGPAWTLDDVTGQYYCHLFLPEQPDLNWRNQRVRAEFDAILRFWLDRGVDGFRIDVAHGLIKDAAFRDLPRSAGDRRSDLNWRVFDSFDHRYDLDQDETLEVYRHWRTIATAHGAVLLGEVGLDDPKRIARYTGPDLLDLALFLRPVWLDWDPAKILSVVRALHDEEPDRGSWVLDNHDQSRSVTRFGGGEVGARRSLAITALMFCLGGMPFIYQGEELGIGNGAIDPADRTDPIALLNEGAVGRDGARSAMPWTPGPGNGFTVGTPWLQAADRPAGDTVEAQLAAPDSWLHRFRALIAAHRAHDDLWTAPAEWRHAGSAEVAVVERGSMFVVANLSDHPVTVDPPQSRRTLVFASSAAPLDPNAPSPTVPPETTIIYAVTRDH
jgi:alpha-glucosidase